MIDQATIAVLPEQVQIKPELIEEEKPALDDGFYPIRYNRSNDAKKTENAMEAVYHSSFDIFADRALSVLTRSAERRDTKRSEQFIYRIDLNLRKILWGHNGRTLADGEDLCHALLIVRHALKHLLVRPEEASTLIPGVKADKLSYWRKMELAMDVRDPDGVIRQRLELMRTPSIRRKQKFYQNTSLLDGKELDLKVYDKSAQMCNRHKIPLKKMIAPDKDPITRLEVVLKGSKMTNFSSLDSDLNPMITTIENKPRLTGFTWEQLRSVHRQYFSSLKAVYHVAAEEGAKPEKSYAAVFAAIALEHDIHPSRIFDLMVNLSGKKPDTCRNIRRQIEWHLGQASELTAEQLLSDEAYRTQPSIDVEGLSGCRFYVKRYGWGEIDKAMADVQKVYGNPPKKYPTLAWRMKPYKQW